MIGAPICMDAPRTFTHRLLFTDVRKAGPMATCWLAAAGVADSARTAASSRVTMPPKRNIGFLDKHSSQFRGRTAPQMISIMIHAGVSAIMMMTTWPPTVNTVTGGRRAGHAGRQAELSVPHGSSERPRALHPSGGPRGDLDLTRAAGGTA